MNDSVIHGLSNRLIIVNVKISNSQKVRPSEKMVQVQLRPNPSSLMLFLFISVCCVRAIENRRGVDSKRIWTDLFDH